MFIVLIQPQNLVWVLFFHACVPYMTWFIMVLNLCFLGFSKCSWVNSNVFPRLIFVLSFLILGRVCELGIWVRKPSPRVWDEFIFNKTVFGWFKIFKIKNTIFCPYGVFAKHSFKVFFKPLIFSEGHVWQIYATCFLKIFIFLCLCQINLKYILKILKKIKEIIYAFLV